MENTEIKYSKDHEWVMIEDDIATIGISAHAAEALGDITFVELPEIEADFIAGDTLSVIESVKAASDIFSPISGKVLEVNTEIEDDPSLVNSSPEKDGWICKLQEVDDAEIEGLMSAEEYSLYAEETSQ